MMVVTKAVTVNKDGLTIENGPKVTKIYRCGLIRRSLMY